MAESFKAPPRDMSFVCPIKENGEVQGFSGFKAQGQLGTSIFQLMSSLMRMSMDLRQSEHLVEWKRIIGKLRDS